MFQLQLPMPKKLQLSDDQVGDDAGPSIEAQYLSKTRFRGPWRKRFAGLRDDHFLRILEFNEVLKVSCQGGFGLV